MNREKALVKNTLILSFGTVVPKLVNVVTLPILTGFLSKTDYGVYDLVVSMVTLLLPVATLQLQAAAFRFLIDARDDVEQQKAIATNILVVTTVISLCVLTLLYVFLSHINQVGRILICAYYLMDILNATIRQIARGVSKNVAYSISVVVNSASEGLAIIGFVLVMGRGLNGALLASLIGQVASLVQISLGVKITSLIDFGLVSAKTTKSLIRYSWPLIPNSLSSWAISMSDRLILTIALGVEASAIYAAALKIPNMLSIFQSAFSLAWQENASLSSLDSDRGAYYSKTFDAVFCLLAGGLALLIAASPAFFSILIKGDYSESYIHMNILFLGSFASCISGFLGGIYIACMRTKEIGVTTTAVAIINILLEVILVPQIGIYAASISYTVSFAALAVYRAMRLSIFQPISFSKKKIVGTCFALVAMVIVGASGDLTASMINLPLALALFFGLNRRLIGMVANRMRGNR